MNCAEHILSHLTNTAAVPADTNTFSSLGSYVALCGMIVFHYSNPGIGLWLWLRIDNLNEKLVVGKGASA